MLVSWGYHRLQRIVGPLLLPYLNSRPLLGWMVTNAWKRITSNNILESAGIHGLAFSKNQASDLEANLERDPFLSWDPSVPVKSMSGLNDSNKLDPN